MTRARKCMAPPIQLLQFHFIYSPASILISLLFSLSLLSLLKHDRESKSHWPGRDGPSTMATRQQRRCPPLEIPQGTGRCSVPANIRRALLPRSPNCMYFPTFLVCPAHKPQNAHILPAPKSFTDVARNGYSFFEQIQSEDGHWACDYGGPSFLTPALVFAMYITDQEIPSEWKIEMTRYLAHHVNTDGGWGIHLEDTTTVFATTCYYVMLRILGMEADHPLASRARERLLELGMFYRYCQNWIMRAHCLAACDKLERSSFGYRIFISREELGISIPSNRWVRKFRVLNFEQQHLLSVS